MYVSEFAHMRVETERDDERPGHPSREVDRRLHLQVDGQEILTVNQQEEIGILSAEVRARLAEAYGNGGHHLEDA